MSDTIHTIGLYEAQSDIPAGKWGYVIDDRFDCGFAGSFYAQTADEALIWEDWQTAKEADLLQESAPTTIENLLAIADRASSDEVILEERRRIIGSEISVIGGSSGLIAQVVDLSLVAGDSNRLLAFSVSGEAAFQPGIELPNRDAAQWTFNPDEIKNLTPAPGYYGSRISFWYQGSEYAFSREVLDPRVGELHEQAEQNRKNAYANFDEAIINRDYDPRLAKFLEY